MGYSDFGFSNRWNYVDGELFEDYSKYKFLKKIALNFNEIIKYKIYNNGYEIISIDINFKNYKKLLSDKIKAKSNFNLLDNPNFVNGDVVYKGEKFKAKIRLKGASSHFSTRRQMSLRIHLKDGKTIFGFNKFSIHKISERQYPSDYIYQDIQKNIGNLSNNHTFTKVLFNGENWGIMNVEEHISTELIEKQRKKDSIVIKLSDDKKLLYKLKSGNNFIENYKLSDPNLFFEIYNGDNKIESENIRKKISYITEELVNQNLPAIIDYESYIRALFLCAAWGNFHPMLNINKRYYFNPYTNKLEILTTDQDYYKKINDISEIGHLNTFKKDNRLIIDSIIREESRYLNDKYINRILDRLESNIIDSFNKFNNDSFFPLDGYKKPTILLSNIAYLRENYKEFTKQLIYDDKSSEFKYLLDKKKISFFPQHIYFNHYDNGNIDIYNLVNHNLIIKEILFGDQILEVNKVLKKTDNKITLNTNILNIKDGKIKIKTTLNDEERINNNKYTLISRDIYNPLKSYKGFFNIFEKTKDGDFIIKSGSHSFEELVYIKGNLIIEPDVKLFFAENSGMIIEGNITINGTKQNPVIFDKKDKNNWKGIYIYNAKERSLLKNVSFKNVKNIDFGILNLTGSINFYKSDVTMKNVTIENVDAEDALNIINSNFKIDSIKIFNTSSDAIDFDFSNGHLASGLFKNIKGDGLDYSGSITNIENINFYNISDKSISAGEESFLKIKNVYSEKSFIGIAVKDGSKVEIIDAKFKNIMKYALMTFKKKEFYDYPILEAKNITYDDSDKLFMSQKGSSLIINKEKKTEQDFNINTIYAK